MKNSKDRKCTLCNLDVIEDMYHMVMDCTYYYDLRRIMEDKLASCILTDTMDIISQMPNNSVYMGMDFPIEHAMLYT